MNLAKMMKMFNPKKMFPVTCDKCRRKITNIAEATDHYNNCEATRKETSKVMKKVQKEQ